ncbi:MAG: hypothetical protein WED04_05805 [Promethearchaeati archaeon SRVP18_Atabeyarchaeia-1]
MRANPLMNREALSQEERSYLLGLYLADGWVSRQSKGSLIVTFSLQGNEEAIVDRVAALMRRANLKPHVGRWFDNCILVYACCKNLCDFFPDKEGLSRDKAARQRFFDNNNLLRDFANRVAFCAGLLDGDGWCKAYLLKGRKPGRRSFEYILIKWGFSQLSYPFLIPLFQGFLESLAPNSTNIGYIRHVGYETVRYVRINKRAREALLQAGVAVWSWKATEFQNVVSEFHAKRDRERTDAMEKAVGGDIKLVDVARMLGVSCHTPYQRYRYGSLNARLVHVRKGRPQKYLVIPREEVERLMKRKSQYQKERISMQARSYQQEG